MDIITLEDLEVFYHIGVPDEERVHPQRLLISVKMETDFTLAAAGDDLSHTINYYAVSQRLLSLGQGRTWKLLETLAVQIAELVLREFGARRVHVEIKKFIIPEARHVSVQIRRPQ
ncbi:MAG: dihydroneopterin aldolase [Verrucomicrobia bacterium]|nr:dihydroneopterin aldolase [Verrucomicrobiota bacterium]